MITFWQQEDSKLVKKEPHELSKDQNTWIDVRSITREDIRILEEEYHVQQEHILDILDQDELSRIEKDDDYTLIILRLPVYVRENDISYYTIPLGIVLYADTIITICWTDCEVLKDIGANRIKSIMLKDFPAFITRILSRADFTFLRYLKEINRRSANIQDELQLSIKNNELIQLLNLQKSLVYFTTSLKSNQMLLEKLTKTHLLSFDKDDREWLEDVTIDNKQAIEMADTYSNILSGMTDSFASVISNNLNIVMRKLTVFSIMLMVPTFVTSFFGMNVKLPLADLGWTGTIIILVMCILTTYFTWKGLERKPKKEVIKKKKKKKKKNDD